MSMTPENPNGINWDDGAGECPNGTYSLAIEDAEVLGGANPGLILTLRPIEAYGDTPPPDDRTPRVEWRAYLRDMAAGAKFPDRIQMRRREFKALVTATGQEMPDLSDFGSLDSLRGFAATIASTTVPGRVYRSAGKVYVDFAVRL